MREQPGRQQHTSTQLTSEGSYTLEFQTTRRMSACGSSVIFLFQGGACLYVCETQENGFL